MHPRRWLTHGQSMFRFNMGCDKIDSAWHTDGSEDVLSAEILTTALQRSGVRADRARTALPGSGFGVI
jgi:hypothetical protein